MASSLSAVIAAAGAGRRYGGLGQLQDKVGGKSVLSHSLDVFEADEDCSEIILVVSAEVRAWIAGDPLTFASGKLKLKQLPSPTALVTLISPPCCSTMAFTMAKPRPFPWISRRSSASTR